MVRVSTALNQDINICIAGTGHEQQQAWHDFGGTLATSRCDVVYSCLSEIFQAARQQILSKGELHTRHGAHVPCCASHAAVCAAGAQSSESRCRQGRHSLACTATT